MCGSYEKLEWTITCRYPVSTQPWNNVGPASQTMGQHWFNLRVYWVLLLQNDLSFLCDWWEMSKIYIRLSVLDDFSNWCVLQYRRPFCSVKQKAVTPDLKSKQSLHFSFARQYSDQQGCWHQRHLIILTQIYLLIFIHPEVGIIGAVVKTACLENRRSRVRPPLWHLTMPSHSSHHLQEVLLAQLRPKCAPYVG